MVTMAIYLNFGFEFCRLLMEGAVHVVHNRQYCAAESGQVGNSDISETRKVELVKVLHGDLKPAHYLTGKDLHYLQ